MKLNNKGMSIIEIVLSFAMIMVMVVSMLTIVVNYRNKAQLSVAKLRLDTFKNNLTQDIQNDILTLGVKKIDTSGECEILTDLSNCINIVFNDNSSKAFGVSKISANDRESVQKKYLYYDGIKYKLNEVLPDDKPENRNWVDLQSIIVEDNNILTTDSTILEDGTNVSLYSIDVNISHVDFKEDFGIHVIASSTGKIGNGEIIENEQAKFLKNKIFNNNLIIYENPTLTTSSNNTSDPSGLYKSTATNSGNPTYYFRGNVENNYVDFAGFIWRIVRINEDGTIRIVMQDGISGTNYQFNSSYRNPTYMYYSNSDAIKPTLETWYQKNIASNEKYSDKVMTGNYYCEQAKVAYSSQYATNSGADMITYLSYKEPNFKCETDKNGKGLIEASVGLLNYDEVLHAGGYYEMLNSHYYLYNNVIYWWTMSPAGFSGSTASVWYVNNVGSIYNDYLSNIRGIRPVLNLKSDTIVTGLGTSESPWVVTN